MDELDHEGGLSKKGRVKKLVKKVISAVKNRGKAGEGGRKKGVTHKKPKKKLSILPKTGKVKRSTKRKTAKARKK